MEKNSKIFKISYRLMTLILCVIIVGTLITGILSYVIYRNSAIRSLSDNLLTIARISASLIEPTQYREIMASLEPNDYHEWLSEKFTDIVHEQDIIFLHAGEIERVRGFTGFVEARIPGFYTGLGEITSAHQFPREAFNAMARGTAFVAGPSYAVDYGWNIGGALLIAHAPALDNYGNTFAIVRALDSVSGVTASAMFFALRMVIFSFVAFALLALFPLRFIRRRLHLPLSKLVDGTEAILKGDYSNDLTREAIVSSELLGGAIREVIVFSNDEFGTLSENISVMQNLIRDKSKAELAAQQSELGKGHAQAIADAMLESATYANKIQRNLLPAESNMNTAFSDFSLIWKPRDIVGGDVYWIKQFDTGTVLCVADCTGHGTPGALLTLLVISKLDVIVTPDNCNDTADILYQLDKHMANALNVKLEEFDIMDINDGCDIVAMFIANDGSITFSSGNSNVFICNGKEVIRKKGQRMFIGEGKLKNKNDILTNNISAGPNDKFYLVSDGLYDQPGGKRGKAYGLKEFFEVLITNHHENQDYILDEVWKAFENYRGYEQRVDDISLIAFTPKIDATDSTSQLLKEDSQ